MKNNGEEMIDIDEKIQVIKDMLRQRYWCF